MTTPARTIDTSTFRSTNTRLVTLRRGLPYSDTTSTVPFLAGYERDLRPESTSYPIRSDGTRGPGPWDHRWALYTAPRGPHPIRLYWKNGIYENFFTAPDSLALLNADPDRLCNTIDLRWCKRTSPGAFPYHVESLARTRAIEKVLDSKANWGETLAEMHSTCRGIQKWASDVQTGVRALAKWKRKQQREIWQLLLGYPPGKQKQRDYRKSIGKIGDQIISRWLEYQFALKPLVSDIQGSAEALDWLLNEKGKAARMSFKAGASHESLDDYVIESQWGVGPGRFRVPIRKRAFCHVSVVYDIEVVRGRTLQQLGLTNSASVAWELVPFSWMADYVIGIGDWLKTLTPVEGASFVEGSISRKLEAVTEGGWKLDGVSSSREILLSPSEQQAPYKIGRFQRQVLSNLLPAVRPAFKNRIGLTQTANSLAAISQFMR